MDKEVYTMINIATKSEHAVSKTYVLLQLLA